VNKTVMIVWDPRKRPRAEVRSALLERCATALLEDGVQQLWMSIADDRVGVASPNPFPLFERRMVALVSAFTEDARDVAGPLRVEGFEVASYHVEQSVYRDYGDTPDAGRRDWPDGERSPGVTAVSLLERPGRLDHDEWIRRWHGRMSSVSEEIQPRTRYVRNVVIAPLSPDAPPFEGIVEECWPSEQHVSSPWLFYGAANPWQLVRNMVRIAAAVMHFTTLWRVRTVMMSEYFVVTRDPQPAPATSSRT